MSISAATLALLFFAFITPGPNNLFVTRTALVHGMSAAVPGIVGIVVGSVTMLALAHLGLSEVLLALPGLTTAIAMAGSAVLAWMGIWAMLTAARANDSVQCGSLPHRATHLFAFQFLNPKTWALTLSVAATMPIAGGEAFSRPVVAIYLGFVVIPLVCMTAWALFGRLASQFLASSRRRIAFDRVMGALLTLCAVALWLQEG